MNHIEDVFVPQASAPAKLDRRLALGGEPTVDRLGMLQ